MQLAEALVVAIRWVHLLAAVAFVGSAFFYLVFLSPQLHSQAGQVVSKGLEAGFRELVDVSLAVLLLSGAIMTFERLAGGAASTTYVALLGLKIGLAVAMFHQAYRMRRSGLAGSQGKLRALVLLGCLVLLLAVVLKTMYEAGGRVG